MEDMKTVSELLQDKKKKVNKVSVKGSPSSQVSSQAEQKQQATHTAIWQANKAVEAKQHISAHNLGIERRKQKKANEREGRDYGRII
eukprot:909832-Ditylum_brightwellii.AAC.2